MNKEIVQKKSKRLANARDILLSHDWLEKRESSAKYVTKEYQDFGLSIAGKLNDLEHKALYIKLCKEENRSLINKAISFAVDYPKARNKGSVFMWKLKELKGEMKKKKEEEQETQMKMV